MQVSNRYATERPMPLTNYPSRYLPRHTVPRNPAEATHKAPIAQHTRDIQTHNEHRPYETTKICAVTRRGRATPFTDQLRSAFKDYAAVSTQNSRFRKYMEDECVVIPNFIFHEKDIASYCFFAVYDGHGGSYCSKYAAHRLHKNLMVSMKNAHEARCKRDSAQAMQDTDIHRCFEQAYAETDAALIENEEAATCGTTAVTCLVRKLAGRITYYIANVGDSRALLYAKGMTRRLTIDHKASNKEEANRIRAAKGIIVNKRVGGVVAVARALGQADEKEFIISQPHYVSGEVEASDSFIVLFSDGIADVFSDEEVTEFIHSRFEEGIRAVRICKELLDASKDHGAMDNMTVVIISLAGS